MKSMRIIAPALVAICLLVVPLVGFREHELVRKPTRRYINLPNRPVEAPFSDGVLNCETLYIAGRIGIDPKTGKPPEDLEQEIKILTHCRRS